MAARYQHLSPGFLRTQWADSIQLLRNVTSMSPFNKMLSDAIAANYLI